MVAAARCCAVNTAICVSLLVRGANLLYLSTYFHQLFGGITVHTSLKGLFVTAAMGAGVVTSIATAPAASATPAASCSPSASACIDLTHNTA